MNKKVLIVGGVAGGASAAARLRRLDENAQIILFERGEYISFANCGLPYYIGETIKDRQKLLVSTPKAMKDRFNIDVRVNSEVTGIDIKSKKVKIKNNNGNSYEESYDYLILSPGAKPIKPKIPGIEGKRIFTLRNIPDTDNIKAFIEKDNIKNAVIVGGGYIGVETAENLKKRGMNVKLVEAAPHILAPFDTDMEILIEKELIYNGISIILNNAVKSFKENDDRIETTLNDGSKLSSDLVILAIGVTPDTDFIKTSGIKLGAKGHIITNDKMQTNIQNIYAVGDAAEVTDFVNGKNTAIPLAGPANKQGRIAADNISGISSTYKGTQGTSIIKVFDIDAASTGNNERTLKKYGIPFKTIIIHPVSHASYYPNALPMSLKLIFNNKGKILGAQCVGYDGIDKRIDVIGSVMRLGGSVSDLSELELCYAPPFSSAKDPVNMAGFVAQNVLSGRMDTITPEEFLNYDKENTLLIDVRSDVEFENGHVDGALNIPVDNLRENLEKIDKNKKIIAYCQVGLRGYIASRILSQNGYNVKNITGGYKSISSLNSKPESIAEKEAAKTSSDNTSDFNKSLDACGLCCPGPLMQVKAYIDSMSDGEVLKVTASDPGFYEDIKSWCKRTNNELTNLSKDNKTITAFVKKSKAKIGNDSDVKLHESDNKTIVVFSGDLDKAIASFIIANGAASMGKKVTMFFTFWGLNILRRDNKVNVKKNFMDSMFGLMMPRGSRKLKLSNMNMMGIGPKMIRKVMKNKNINSLEDLIQSAVKSGIQIVACQMSMDVMGLKKEELIDGVKIGGVGYYLGEAEDSNVNLFI